MEVWLKVSWCHSAVVGRRRGARIRDLGALDSGKRKNGDHGCVVLSLLLDLVVAVVCSWLWWLCSWKVVAKFGRRGWFMGAENCG